MQWLIQQTGFHPAKAQTFPIVAPDNYYFQLCLPMLRNSAISDCRDERAPVAARRAGQAYSAAPGLSQQGYRFWNLLIPERRKTKQQGSRLAG